MKASIVSALLSVGGYFAYNYEVQPNLSKFLGPVEEDGEIFSEYLNFIAKFGKTN